MGIEITNQLNEQECGVCVITTLHNYYYPHSTIEKEEVLNLSSIGRDGLSIFDFECLSNKVNLECETYQLTWDEFLELKITKYFVLLVSSNNGSNHYVIAKKQKHYIEIYDSCNYYVKKFKYDEIKPLFLGILILVNKSNNKSKKEDINSHKSLLMINTKQILLSILLYSIVFVFSVINASFLNWLIDLVIVNKSITNLITICFVFSLVYILNDLITYIITLYSSNNLKSNFILLTSKVLMALSVKTPSFLNKIDKGWIYKIDECVYHISNYCVVEINKFITNIIFIVVCICIIGIINPWLLIFCTAYLIIELAFFFLSYSKKKELFTRLLKNENNNTINYKSLIFNLENEFWNTKRMSCIEKIKSNYSNLYKNFNDVNLYRSNITLFKSILKSIFEVLFFAIIAYIAIKNTNFTIGKITFVISAMNLLKTASSESFNFLLYRIEFQTYWQVYQDLSTVDNSFKNEKQLELTNVNKLSFCYLGKNIILTKNKNDNILPCNFIEILKSIDNIQIEDDMFKVNDVRLSQTLIVIDEYCKCDKELLIKYLNEKPVFYSKYIRYFKLDLNNKISNYQSLIINLLNLLEESNKIIIFDDIDSYIKENDLTIYKDLLNKIMAKNFVFITRKEQNG